MGFRDIHAFNLAILAKQAWRLIQGSHSLFFRVYKACYFRTCSFMKAGLGSNPSFVWRSLLEAGELIRAAIVWKVDDGRSIKLDDHRWLPHPPKFQPNANMNLRVSDLFDPSTKQWHTQVLHKTFMHSTVEDIQWINLRDIHTQRMSSSGRRTKKAYSRLKRLTKSQSVSNNRNKGSIH